MADCKVEKKKVSSKAAQGVKKAAIRLCLYYGVFEGDFALVQTHESSCPSRPQLKKGKKDKQHKKPKKGKKKSKSEKKNKK